MTFVNPDLTVHLAHEPVGEWIGLDARSHYGALGAGMSDTALYDRSGRHRPIRAEPVRRRTGLTGPRSTAEAHPCAVPVCRAMPPALCVYCGSNIGTSPAFVEAARQLGAAMARRGIRLVYGGGHVGLMGALADAVLECRWRGDRGDHRAARRPPRWRTRG